MVGRFDVSRRSDEVSQSQYRARRPRRGHFDLDRPDVVLRADERRTAQAARSNADDAPALLRLELALLRCQTFVKNDRVDSDLTSLQS
jgi:hypothetical protein